MYMYISSEVFSQRKDDNEHSPVAVVTGKRNKNV